MPKTTITQLPDPSGFSSDPFTDVLRDGARKLIEQAIHAELAALMNAFSGETGAIHCTVVRLACFRLGMLPSGLAQDRQNAVAAQAMTNRAQALPELSGNY